jgi:ABC-2 type transport system permease protein
MGFTMPGDLLRELWLITRLNFRPLSFFVASMLSTAMWLVVVVLAIAWYGGDISQTARHLFWGMAVFLIFSEQVWGAAVFNTLARTGVVDYVAATPVKLHMYLFAVSLAYSAVAAPGVLILLGIYYLLLGEFPPLAQPVNFAAAFVIFVTAAALLVSLFTFLFIRLRNPNFVVNVLQWAVPLSGGMIPPTAMPPEAAQFFLLSPFHYVIAPVVYSATGVWLADPPTTLALGAVVAVVFYALALYAAKSAMWRYRATGKWGVE